MKTTLLTDLTVADICKGFKFSRLEGKGLFGWDEGHPKYFDSLSDEKKNLILQTPLTIYIREGTETEIKSWFKTINIAGIPLNKQEIANSIYSGSFVTLAKAEFSNSQKSELDKWKSR